MIPNLLLVPFLTTATGMPMDQVAALVIAIVLAMGGGGVIGKKISDARKVTVTMEEQFISRREFEKHQAATDAGFTKLEGIMTRQADRVETKHLELLATIEAAAETGVNGRVALWNELRDQGKALAKVEERTNIGDRLERVARELIQNKPRPRGQ